MRNEEMQLSNYCRWNDTNSLTKLLEKYSDLDLIIKDGLCFKLSIKHQNIQMLKSLLDYYVKTKLQGYYDSIEYKTAKYTLRQILTDAAEQYDITDEIQEVLTPYITSRDSDTLSLPDDDILEAGLWENNDDEMDSTTIYSLTTSNLREWTNQKPATELIGNTTDIPHDT